MFLAFATMFLLLCSVGGRAQEKGVTINVKNVSLKEVLKSIEKQTSYRFSYRNVVVDSLKGLTVSKEDASVSAILDEVLSGKNLTYSIVSPKSIVISDLRATETKEKGVSVKYSGTVTDANGETIVGASIVLKGSSAGTNTNVDGRFAIDAPAGSVLQISFVGYLQQEITVSDETELRIVLREDSRLLDEVVVVAYGVQKKVNLTGAVSTVSAAKLESRSTTNLSTSLSGLAAGVTVTQSSGKPGDDGAGIRIRGIGTFNGSYLSPLVIVDGSEASINSVNSEDVESISFLKDAASAAIYGSRGANGVLLITTKKGKRGEAPRVTYTGVLSNVKMSGKAFRFESNYAEYMEMANRWSTNLKWDVSGKYPQTEIDEWRAAEGKNPNATDNPYGVPNFLAYPSTQLVDHLFLPSTSHKHNVSIVGGSENSSYLFSLGHLNNPGTLQNTGLKNYTGRINLESQINKFLKVGTQTYATLQKREPGSTSLTYLLSTVPALTLVHNGMYGLPVDGSPSNNPLADVLATGGEHNQTRLNTTWYAGLQLAKGLSAELRYNYQTLFEESNTFSKKIDRYNFRTGEVKLGTNSSAASVTRSSTRYWNNTATATLNYAVSVGEHDFAALLGAERYYWNVKGFSATRIGLLDLTLPDFTAALDKADPKFDGTAEQDYGVVSYFGRLNYAWKNRYLFEVNFRRDGSSRFGPDYRWGTFPSFSAAWRVSEESFMKSEALRRWLSNLKLRASWGQLGNTTSGYYEWQASYGATNYSFDGNVYDGLRQSKIANPLLHWESVTSSDVGLEAAFLNSRLTLEADYYSRLTKGILASPSVYMTMGTISAPTTNTSDMRNRGLEFTLGWRDKIRDFNYGVSVNFSYNHNAIVKYKGKYSEGWEKDASNNQVWMTNRGEVADVSGNTIRVEGHAFDEYYIWERHSGNGNIYLADGVTPDPKGGPKDGMIRTKADLDWVRAMVAHTDANGNKVYNFNNQSVAQGGGLWYGECVYADVNGDGMYGTNDNDRIFTGKSSMPKYSYGINISAEWRGIDFNMTWSGNAGMYYHIYSRGFNNMSNANWQEGAVIAENAREIYYYSDPEQAATNPNYDPATDPNANINAPYPRIGNILAAHRNNTSELYNASYIKLKSLQIGYTLPKAWTSKVFINKLRFFVSGENLLTITNFPGVDPEMGGLGFQSYPIPRMFSGGVNITF